MMGTYEELGKFLQDLAFLESVPLPSERSVYLRCASVGDDSALARALALEIKGMFSRPIHVFRCDGDFLCPGDGDLLVAPLLAGDIVLLLCPHHPLLASTFTDKWFDYLEGDAKLPIPVVQHLDILPLKPLRDPGFLFVVDTTSQLRSPRKSKGLLIPEEEVSKLVKAGKNITLPITVVGRPSRATGLDLTMKDLCLLHGRDLGGASHLPFSTAFNDHQHLFTWTDLQALLLADMKDTPEALDSLRNSGRIDEDKWSYGLGAYDYLSERKRQRPSAWSLSIYESIYDAVWSLDSLHLQGFIFRGQSDARWRMDNTLLRSSSESPLDTQTLVTRVQMTEAFLSELRRSQRDLFGTQMREIDLLAIAQHYGFATPLLDFTRSHRIAAFFATHSARSLLPGKKRIGVIYYIHPERRGFRMNPQYRESNVGDFSLLDVAGIHLGTHYVIEPELPERENRIALQQGVFLAGYQTQDLQSIAIDRIYFLQQPGEVFEDLDVGITQQKLLSDESALHQLAQEVKDRFREEKIHFMVAATRVPTPRLIGSQGDLLYAQITLANEFFPTLTELVAEVSPMDNTLANDLGNVFGGYFEDSQALTAVGELSDKINVQQPLDPFQVAITQLASICHVDENWLRNSVADRLPNKYFSPLARQSTQQAPPSKPGTKFEQIALACAHYLAGWEHLIYVEGNIARNLTVEALGILKGQFFQGELGE